MKYLNNASDLTFNPYWLLGTFKIAEIWYVTENLIDEKVDNWCADTKERDQRVFKMVCAGAWPYSEVAKENLSKPLTATIVKKYRARRFVDPRQCYQCLWSEMYAMCMKNLG